MANKQLCLLLFLALNIVISLNARYIGTPRSTNGSRGALKHPFELKCEYIGADGDGKFVEWFKDDVPVNNEKPGHYVVKTTSKETRLKIKIFVQADSKVKVWSVKTNKPGYEKPAACQFGRILLKRTPQGIETNRADEKIDTSPGSVRRVEDEPITFKCLIQPNQTLRAKAHPIIWEFGVDNEKFSTLPEGVKQTSDDRLEIEHVKKAHRGYYRCTLNGISFSVLLRIKDRLAALWPFLGIVSVVIVLVLIILIFEKRQKAARKVVTREGEDNDQAKDPLVRSTNKSSDNENKKRAIKA